MQENVVGSDSLHKLRMRFSPTHFRARFACSPIWHYSIFIQQTVLDGLTWGCVFSTRCSCSLPRAVEGVWLMLCARVKKHDFFATQLFSSMSKSFPPRPCVYLDEENHWCTTMFCLMLGAWVDLFQRKESFSCSLVKIPKPSRPTWNSSAPH